MAPSAPNSCKALEIYLPAVSSDASRRLGSGDPFAVGPFQEFLDLDRDGCAVDDDHAARDGKVVGENLHLVALGRIERDDRAAAHAQELVDRHAGPAEDNRDVDAYIVETCRHEHTPDCAPRLERRTLNSMRISQHQQG